SHYGPSRDLHSFPTRRSSDLEVEGTNADHSHQLAGLLEPVVLSQLGDADWQVAVAVQLLPVDDDVVRAVHRAELELLAVLEVDRSEEHTSELQSRGHLVCRLL